MKRIVQAIIIILFAAQVAWAIPPLPSSGARIDDTAGNGDTALTWSADKIYDQLAGKQATLTNPITGTSTNHYWPYFTGATSMSGKAITASKPVCSDSSGDPGVCDGTEGVWQVAGSYQAADANLTAYTETTISCGGTADALTPDYTTNVTLADGMRIKCRATAANATTTPSIAPDGLTAHTITKQGGVALVAGDIKGALHEIELVYNLANTRWELLNPANPGSSAADNVDANNIPVKNSAGTYINLTLAGGLALSGTTTQTLTGAAPNADTTGLTAANVPAPTTIVSSGAISVTTKNTYVICTGACQVTLPVAAAGIQACVRNAPGSATVAQLVLRTNQYYELTDHTAWATVSQRMVSGGAATDSICVVGYDATHYATFSHTGTWTDTAAP